MTISTLIILTEPSDIFLRIFCPENHSTIGIVSTFERSIVSILKLNMVMFESRIMPSESRGVVYEATKCIMATSRVEEVQAIPSSLD